MCVCVCVCVCACVCVCVCVCDVCVRMCVPCYMMACAFIGSASSRPHFTGCYIPVDSLLAVMLSKQNPVCDNHTAWK